MLARITKRTVDALKPGNADRFLWDSELKGFGLKVTPAGSKIYILQYRKGGRGSPTKRVTIGRHGAITPEQARKEAARLFGCHRSRRRSCGGPGSRKGGSHGNCLGRAVPG